MAGCNLLALMGRGPLVAFLPQIVLSTPAAARRPAYRVVALGSIWAFVARFSAGRQIDATMLRSRCDLWRRAANPQ